MDDEISGGNEEESIPRSGDGPCVTPPPGGAAQRLQPPRLEPPASLQAVSSQTPASLRRDHWRKGKGSATRHTASRQSTLSLSPRAPAARFGRWLLHCGVRPGPMRPISKCCCQPASPLASVVGVAFLRMSSRGVVWCGGPAAMTFRRAWPRPTKGPTHRARTTAPETERLGPSAGPRRPFWRAVRAQCCRSAGGGRTGPEPSRAATLCPAMARHAATPVWPTGDKRPRAGRPGL